jgi:hypothetical protein
MTSAGQANTRGADAVVGELLRDGEKNAASTKPQAPRGRARAAWVFACLSLAATAASITACLVGLLGLGPFSAPQAVFVAVLVLWPLAILSFFATIGATPKAVQGRGQTMRWRFLRPLMLSLLLLAPFWGQLAALVLGLVTLLAGDPSTRRAMRPSAIVQLCIALGWPGMVVSAMYALAPYFSSEVRLGGPQGPTAAVDLGLANNLEPLSSFLFVYGSIGAFSLVAVVTALALVRHQRRSARQAAETMAGTQVLEAGETVVRGTVDYAQGQEQAVRVEVDQNGTEAQVSGHWRTTWTETDRRVQVAPFYLVHASGERIRVEPTREVHLMDDLDGVVLVDVARRTRYAELIPGEEVIATGMLSRGHDPEASERGYRDSGRGWVLAPPADAPMLLSTHPLDAPFRRRARIFATMAAMVATLAAIGQVTLLPYHLRLWAGEPVTATVERRRVDTHVDSDGETSAHHMVTAASATPRLVVDEEVDRRTAAALVEGSLVPVLFVAVHPPSSQLGAAPRADAAAAVIFPILITLLAFGFMIAAESSKAWYDSKQIVDTEAGRLPQQQQQRTDLRA